MRLATAVLFIATAASADTLTLKQALDTARAHQPALLQARAATVAASARADETRAGLLPQVNLGASYTLKTNNLTPGSVTGIGGSSDGGTAIPTASTRVITPMNVNVSVNQLIWDFQTFWRWEASQKNAIAAEDQERAQLLSTLATARVAYFNARAQKALVKVGHDTLDNQQKHLAQAEGFVKAGTQPEIALAQSKSAVASAKVQVITAENNYESAKATLNQAIGLERDTNYDVGDEGENAVADEDAAVEELVTRAILARPELAALENQVRAQELTIRATKGGYGPSVSLVGSASAGGTDVSALVGNFSAGIVLSWPLFQGWLTPSQVHEQEANLDSLKASTEVTRQQVRLQLTQGWLSVRAAKGTVSAAGEAEDAAKTQLKLAEGRYQAGAGSIIELGDAQVAYTQAAATRVQAEYSLATARAQLLQALGQE
ncbi:MAG: TolC family protein [Myxococcaceae bacterium]